MGRLHDRQVAFRVLLTAAQVEMKAKGLQRAAVVSSHGFSGGGGGGGGGSDG